MSDRLPLRSRLAATIVNRRFKSSDSYWQQRYESGGNSGAGSSGPLARYKAEFLNEFVAAQSIATVVEYGCGDGKQLRLANYPGYLGIDISLDAIERCRELFDGDETKGFLAIQQGGLATATSYLSADLALSLDVIYHLVEDNVYEDYMVDLFELGRRFVVIYSSNDDDNSSGGFAHVRNRRFTDWVDANVSREWEFLAVEPNPHKAPSSKGGAEQTSIADFYVFRRRTEVA